MFFDVKIFFQLMPAFRYFERKSLSHLDFSISLNIVLATNCVLSCMNLLRVTIGNIVDMARKNL